jgi:hypothetical protein
VPSVQHYLVADPDTRVVIHHARGHDDVVTTRIVSEGHLARSARADACAERGIRCGIGDAITSGRKILLVAAAAQIRLFEKLKLAKCARAETRPGLFCVWAEERLFFVLLFTGITGWSALHGSGPARSGRARSSGFARAA